MRRASGSTGPPITGLVVRRVCACLRGLVVKQHRGGRQRRYTTYEGYLAQQQVGAEYSLCALGCATFLTLPRPAARRILDKEKNR
jgi:hypothetical protein